MALQKAYSVSISSTTIDGNEDNTITWQVSGDIQTAFQVDIYLNSDNTLKFSSGKVTSYALKYTLPHGSLTNGNEYKIKITIFNSSNSSITNDGDVFQTSSRPVVTVDTIGTVGSFSYNFTSSYNQSESVSLRNYVANLYDASKNLLSTSGILTTTPLQYLFDGLQTETSYYIEFQATSSKGLTGTSGLVSFNVFYLRPKMNVQLESKNIDNAGVEISWFVSQIIGSTTGSKYINNDEIDTTDGTKVWFDSGFSIAQDFSLKVWLRNIPNKQDLITLYGDNGKITLQYYWLDNKFHLTKTDSVGNVTNYETNNALVGTDFVVLIQQVNKDLSIDGSVIS